MISRGIPSLVGFVREQSSSEECGFMMLGGRNALSDMSLVVTTRS